MSSLLKSLEITVPPLLAKTDGLGWMRGTVMISAQPEGSHFTGVYASCHEMVLGG